MADHDVKRHRAMDGVRDAWDTYRKLVLRGMARAARKGWRSYAEMVCHGAIQTQEAEDNGKEHHTGADRSG